MNNIVTPNNQKQYLSPYGARLFDFNNNADSRVYLSNAINTLFNAIGKNCILEGLGILNLNYNQTTDIISMDVEKGKIIIDSTLVELPESTHLELDVSGLNDTGKLIVSLGFSYTPTIYANNCVMKLLFVSQDGTQVFPGDFFEGHDRIIAAVFNFNKINKTVTQQNWNTVLESRLINIFGKDYEINPMDHFTTRVRDLLV